MPWPTEHAVTLATEALDALYDRDEMPTTHECARIVLDAGGLPELAGNTEAAEILGIRRGNLSKVKGMPDPAVQLAGGRFWLADDLRELARRRQVDGTGEMVMQGRHPDGTIRQVPRERA